MIPTTDGTHDASLRSWVDSANDPATDFPVQNLPLGVFRRGGARPTRVGCAIGDQVLDLSACAERGLLRGMPSDVEDGCRGTSLNALMALEPRLRGTLRHRLSHLLRAEGGFVTARADAAQVLLRQADVEMLLPATVGDYTDFYASVFHATNVGKMLRPENPLLPNYKWVPIGYHGRASSLVASGTGVRRPSGQTETAGGGPPAFGPSRNLDYELEVGAFLGPGNALGAPVPLAEAEDRIFGLCLVNDWSARDLQKWEYQPLGPFLSKSFATSVSPWVVTLDALAPYRVPAFARPEGDPRPLPYLADEENEAHGGIDLRLEALLSSRAMRERGLRAVHALPQQPPRPLLDPGADGGAPRVERLQPPARRPDRERDGVGRGEGGAGLPPGEDVARHGAPRPPLRRGATLPGGRRRGDPARPLRARGLRPHRLRRVPGDRGGG